MTPAKQAGLWLAQFLSFFIIFAAFYLLLPEVYLFEIFSNSIGFITEADWNDLFMFAVLGLSVLINALLILAVGAIKQKRGGR